MANHKYFHEELASLTQNLWMECWICMFCAIWEFAPSAHCIVQTEDPQILIAQCANCAIIIIARAAAGMINGLKMLIKLITNLVLKIQHNLWWGWQLMEQYPLSIQPLNHWHCILNASDIISHPMILIVSRARLLPFLRSDGGESGQSSWVFCHS